MSLIVAEYRCPEHGVFESLVERPAPDDMPCPESMYVDGDCCHDCAGLCGEASPWCMSAPKPKVLSVPCYATVRGGDTERRPGMLDTRPLAEGMPKKEWDKIQANHRRARRHKMLIDKGLTSKKIQVG